MKFAKGCLVTIAAAGGITYSILIILALCYHNYMAAFSAFVFAAPFIAFFAIKYIKSVTCPSCHYINIGGFERKDEEQETEQTWTNRSNGSIYDTSTGKVYLTSGSHPVYVNRTHYIVREKCRKCGYIVHEYNQHKDVDN